MRRLLSYLHSLFTSSASFDDDHLMGAVDLSDSYCSELLNGKYST
ncbi:MAG: hypothetical protein V4463_23335 [Pseudomonadota bacterium]